MTRWDSFGYPTHPGDRDYSTSESTEHRPPIPGDAPLTRYARTYCSQCGQAFGPGEHGWSHCENHAHLTPEDE